MISRVRAVVRDRYGCRHMSAHLSSSCNRRTIQSDSVWQHIAWAQARYLYVSHRKKAETCFCRRRTTNIRCLPLRRHRKVLFAQLRVQSFLILSSANMANQFLVSAIASLFYTANSRGGVEFSQAKQHITPIFERRDKTAICRNQNLPFNWLVHAGSAPESTAPLRS